jgi:hypothetical protein
MGNTSSSTPLSDVLSGIQGIVGRDSAKPVASPTYPLFINEVSRKGEQPAAACCCCNNLCKLGISSSAITGFALIPCLQAT